MHERDSLQQILPQIHFACYSFNLRGRGKIPKCFLIDSHGKENSVFDSEVKILILIYPSYLERSHNRFLLFYIERVPDPASFLPEQHRMGFLLDNVSWAEILSFYPRKSRVLSSDDSQGHSGHKSCGPQLEPSHHLDRRG